MNGHVFRLDIPPHQAVQELLPWYATGQLAPRDAELVQQHLCTCHECRRDLEWDRAMCAAPSEEPAGIDMERALARLRPALGARESAPGTGAAPARPGPGLRWVLAAQWLLIAGLLVLLARPEPAPRYQALGAARATGNLIVTFRPETSERELRRILQTHGARVVDGPTATDAYLLSVPAHARTAALQALRVEPAVILAASLDGGDAP